MRKPRESASSAISDLTLMDYRKTRKESLSGVNPLDHDLIRIVESYPSHRFLANPASQNLFLYLTRYVMNVLELHFQSSIDTIDILDWGCGKGHITYLLKKLGAYPVSCDIDKSSEDSSFGQDTPIINQTGINVIPLNHDYLLPFGDCSFDAVLSFGVLEHVLSDLESLHEIHRILRNNGLFICLNLPYLLSWTQRLAHLRGDRYHDRLYSVSHVKRLLKSSGFQLIDLWHRQLFPKNSIRYPKYRLFEKLDQLLTDFTPLKFLATNIEFLASKS